MHEVVIKGGKQVETHLCESCAQGAGFDAGAQTPQEVAAMLASFAAGQNQRSSQPGQPSCGSCGLTFREFRHSGLLGCAVCYRAFGDRLDKLLVRAHEGGTQHIGKRPPEPAGGTGTAHRIEEIKYRSEHLRRKLQDAIEREDYEQAARLRDELSKAQSELERAAGGSGEGARPGGVGFERSGGEPRQ